MRHEWFDRRRIRFIAALCFEASLGGAALLLGFLFRHEVIAALSVTPRAVGMGFLSTLPLLAILAAAMRSKRRTLRELRGITERIVLRFFGRLSLPAIILLSSAAGFGEELLFRGFLQSILIRLFSSFSAGEGIAQAAGLLSASLLFGLFHALSRTYFLYSTLMSLWLGAIFLASGNLLVPIICHAVYDAAAMAAARRSGGEPGAGHLISLPIDR